MTPNKSDSGELPPDIALEYLAMNIVFQIGDALYEALPKDIAHDHFVDARQKTNDVAIDFAKKLVTTHIQAVGDEAFKEGQRVGQYQAADKLYSHTTTMWLFKEDLENPKLQMPERADDLLKDCEKYLNHNRKAYTEYLRSDRYKRLNQYLGEGK